MGEHGGPDDRVGGVDQGVDVGIELALHGPGEGLQTVEERPGSDRDPQDPRALEAPAVGEVVLAQREGDDPMAAPAGPHRLADPPAPGRRPGPDVETGEQEGGGVGHVRFWRRSMSQPAASVDRRWERRVSR